MQCHQCACKPLFCASLPACACLACPHGPQAAGAVPGRQAACGIPGFQAHCRLCKRNNTCCMHRCQ